MIPTNQKAHKIKPNHLLDIDGQTVNIRTLTHAKLGTTSTVLEILDIYIMNSTLSSEELKVMIYKLLTVNLKTVNLASLIFAETKKMTNEDSQTANKMSYKLSNSDLKTILLGLKTNLAEFSPLISVETFGNKRSTMDIQNKIYDVSEVDICENLVLDICISSSCGPGTVVVANDSYFQELGIRHS